MKRRHCFGCCTDNDSAVDSTSDSLEVRQQLQALNSAAGASDDDGPPSKFLRLAPDNPWLVCRSPDHGGKLFWMHEHTQETTWRQPLPRLAPLTLESVDSRMRQQCFAVDAW